MKIRLLSIVAFAVMVSAVLGCSAPIPTAPPPPTPAAKTSATPAPAASAAAAPTSTTAPANADPLVEEWKTLVSSATRETMDATRAGEIAGTLVKAGPEKLIPLLDIIAAKDANPFGRVIAVMALSPYVTGANQSKIIDMTRPPCDTYARACAAQLLSSLQQRRLADQAGTARLKELMGDTEPPVRNAAVIGLLMASDPDGIKRAVELWSDPSVTVSEKNSIILNMPQMAVLQHLDMYAQAVNDTSLAPGTRKQVLSDLGVVGDGTVLEALKKCAANETDQTLKDLADASVKAVEAREQQGLKAAPINPNSSPGTSGRAQLIPLQTTASDSPLVPVPAPKP